MTSSDTHHRFARACRRSHRPPTHPSSPRWGDGRWLRRQHQRGVVAIEFALLFMLGVLPLLLLTVTGVMLFAAKQSLELAAADGARAALQYPAPNTSVAKSVATQRMQWLLNFCASASGSNTDACDDMISVPPTASPCVSGGDVDCITVTTTFDYNAHPFLPGTKTLYKWALGGDGKLTASATIQLPKGS